MRELCRTEMASCRLTWNSSFERISGFQIYQT